MAAAKKRVLILGGGFGGAYAAKKLLKSLKDTDVDLTVVDRNNYLLFYPLLVEAGVGVLEPRHVVVPIRKFIPNGDFRMAEVLSVDLEKREVAIQTAGYQTTETLNYDHLVMGLGSITKVPSIPGLREYGFQLKSLSDAISMRDRGIRLLELANTLPFAEDRRSLLRVIVVGANFTGVEFAGEYQAFLVNASKQYRNVDPSEIEVRILELGDRILPAVDSELSEWAVETLSKRGLLIQTGMTVSEVGQNYAVLKTGERLGTHTVLWAAGIAPNPLIASIDGLPKNSRGYIDCERDFRVKGRSNVWAIGDGATVYDPHGKPYAATAQTATREGTLVAENVLASISGQPLKDFEFKALGSFASIGHRSAAAEVLGLKFKGFLGWFLYRGAYLMKMPTLTMKVRLAMDWLLELLLPSEIVQLGVHQANFSSKPTGEDAPVEAKPQEKGFYMGR